MGASVNMTTSKRDYSLEYSHMVCNGLTKQRSEQGLFTDLGEEPGMGMELRMGAPQAPYLFSEKVRPGERRFFLSRKTLFSFALYYTFVSLIILHCFQCALPAPSLVQVAASYLHHPAGAFPREGRLYPRCSGCLPGPGHDCHGNLL